MEPYDRGTLNSEARWDVYISCAIVSIGWLRPSAADKLVIGGTPERPTMASDHQLWSWCSFVKRGNSL